MDRSVPFMPERGKVYRLHGQKTEFLCVSGTPELGKALAQNTKTGWRMTVRGPRRYPDGTIEWDYSTGGRFAPLEKEES